ncbi:hypothetical protein BKA67DRAFT_692188 [Truncatella angustata]|uniref:WKF domain-containing protein n=1 Tax=Truncatella angustata TaxID=152316 RepID=A0A9P8UIQ1_9PEZI|nr:uncharacterized protein BKA67DRAFT_692188 [Truncatella angustata]KAH6652899.1 hypothetical protein BKA67DRAFT_692188 [Truncatella angustata]
MSSSTDGRVPAWKRLGLKLKAAPDSQTESAPSRALAAPSPLANGISAAGKRKSFGASEPDHSAKKPRRDNISTPSKSNTPKAVSFAAEPEVRTFTTPTAKEKKPPKKEKQKPAKPAQQTPRGTQPNNAVKPLAKKENAVANLQSALEYLRQWHSARDSWKFNKNHQTRLLEYVFSDETTIPAVDIDIFFKYISPLKGFVRKRLRETAVEVKNKDMDQGAEGFSSSNKQAAVRKQKEYEEIIAGFLKEGTSPGKRRFEEVDYVLRTTDMEMQRRVVKRMRAEMVLDELSGSEDSETSTSTATVTDAESEDTAGEASKESGSGAPDGDKRAKLNDGTQRRIRRKKVRTAEVEDTSSSSDNDSDSDSDSDTSSSGSDSSDDSDSDVVMEVDQTRNEAETSSSSSSSSSSEAESDDDSSDQDES